MRRTPTLLAAAVLAGTLIAATPSGPAAAAVGPIPGLPTGATAVMDTAPYANATWAVSVTDALTGEPLVAYNAGLLLEPASVTKTISTAGAWLQFGPASRIVTPVVRTGAVTSGRLAGDLVLVARGDITMGGQTGPDRTVVFADMDHNDANDIPGATLADNDPMAGLDALARQVRRSGISSVSGDVVIDDRLFRTEDLGGNGPVSPIVINNNLIDVEVTATRPGRRASVSTRALVEPWTVRNRVRTVAAGGTTAVRIGATGTDITVSGTIADDAQPVLRVWQVPDPAAFARSAFIEALMRAGVAVHAPVAAANPVSTLGTRKAVGRLPVVARLRSLPLSEQATYVLKVSYNRGAQTFVCLLAVSAGSRDCDEGFPVLAQRLSSIGVDPGGIVQVDGSGLPGNYATASTLASLMTAFAARPDWALWRSTLPIMGVDGSIAIVQVDSPAAGHVFAKTGTLGAADLLNGRLRLGSKALGGYVQARSGRWLSMAIIVNQSVFDDIKGLFAANEDVGTVASAIWAAY